jgi:hypothetical protein
MSQINIDARHDKFHLSLFGGLRVSFARRCDKRLTTR